jgi:UDP-N-acetylmuramoyl-tripeptide--D-alanyl-D-alanine ligase
MKSNKIIYLEKILRFMAKTVLWKYKPTIVGITGSVGKTSTKEAVFQVLQSKFNVRKNEKNYNNEIGLPLTIIGVESGNRSPWKWLKVILRWLFIIIFPIKYPEILVLEMGVDRPGDMEYLLSFIKPVVGIFTNISGSHLEFFKSTEHIAREKGKIVRDLPAEGLAILNADDAKVLEMADKIKSPVALFGFGEKAEIRASYVSFNLENFEPQGISFKLNYQGKSIPVRLPFVLAPHLIYAALSALAAGIFFKINLVDIAGALESFSPPKGRMNLIKGANKSYLIDDSYNSSPASAIAALDVVKNLRAMRKIAALGDMLELGENSEAGHEEVLKHAFESGVTVFFLEGGRMKNALEKIDLQGQISGSVYYFDDPDSLGRELRKILREGDLVLVKGSQGTRMEKAVREIMAVPEDVEKFLCRQSKDWQKKPFIKP